MGAQADIDEVEASVQAERAAAGKFDAILQAWNNDPSPSSGVAQVWSHAGFGGSNFLRYDNPWSQTEYNTRETYIGKDGYGVELDFEGGTRAAWEP